MNEGTAGPLSVIGMLAQADGVVQSVVAALIVASVACWAIIFEKLARLVRLRRSVARVEAFARSPEVRGTPPDGLLAALMSGVGDELREIGAAPDRRARAEQTLRAICLREVRQREAGLSYLATLASSAPFVGLFGTVWGIMHSFTSIAEAQDTSLAAVAPGIAEALLATAVGLGAAIPAVIGYNQLRAGFARCGQRLAFASTALARAATSAPAKPEDR